MLAVAVEVDIAVVLIAPLVPVADGVLDPRSVHRVIIWRLLLVVVVVRVVGKSDPSSTSSFGGGGGPRPPCRCRRALPFGNRLRSMDAT